MAGSTRRNRLAESRRRLTKLLIIAALIEYGLQIGDIDVGKVIQDDIDEAADLAKHGSVHVPTVVINVKQLDGFGGTFWLGRICRSKQAYWTFSPRSIAER